MGVVHGDDILLAGPRSLVDAERSEGLRNGYDAREHKGSVDRLDPRHVKEIIEELCQKGVKCVEDPPMFVCPSGKMTVTLRCHSASAACRQVELLGNESPRHSLRCIDHGVTHRARKMRTRSCSREWDDSRLGDPSLGLRSDHIMSYTDSDWRSVRRGMLAHREILQILRKKAEGVVALVVGK